VHFLTDEATIHRTSHLLVDDTSDVASDCYPVTQLFARLRCDYPETAGSPRGVMLVPHVGGRPYNLEFHDPDLEPLIEIYSGWGEFEWAIRDIVRRGYVMGFSAGSDDHSCRPGAARRGAYGFPVKSGLTCVFAQELTREEVWRALWARRCVATTGQRAILVLRADGHWMGEKVSFHHPPTFSIEALGTTDIEQIELFRGMERIFTYPDPMPRSRDSARVSWRGAVSNNRARNACWDGSLSIVNGEFMEAHGYAFDAPDEGITTVTPGRVEWRSVTGGDADGVVVRVMGGSGARLKFETPLLQREVSLDAVREQPVRVSLDGVDLEVTFEMLPLGTRTTDVEVSFTDEFVPEEQTPYWVRLLQSDGEKAWASPLFVSRAL
jgi:hypothetical protein